jgi:hypothetical protein
METRSLQYFAILCYQFRSLTKKIYLQILNFDNIKI